MKRKIRISLQRVRVPGRKSRLVYYRIDFGSDNSNDYMWLEPSTYYSLKKAIEHFDGFLERITSKKTEVKNEPDTR